ncbi:MAG: SulP family inorganic anion transporter [Bacteroidota bacterium]
MNSVFRPKLFSVMSKGYSREQFFTDSMAGVIVGVVALPLAIAFAVASGVSPEKGLITAVIAGFIISFLGGSRVQIGGPTGAFIVIVYGIVEQYGLNGLLISTFLAGVLLVLFGILKLGSLLKYIPHPLVVGFTSGIALVIFSTQVKDALGLATGPLPSGFLDKWGVYFQQIGSVNWYALGLTLLTIVITLVWKKVSSKIPGSLIAILLLTLAVKIFALPVSTIETSFGNIPNTFSFSMPDLSLSGLSVYFMPALTIALLGAIESLLSAVVSDGMIGSTHRSNTELIAQGIANMVTPFFGGIPATGAIARTATNVRSGGRTPVAGMVHAVTLLLIMLFFGRWAKLIPMSVLAGILIVVAYNMSEWRSFVSILRGSAFDIIVLLVTFFLTVLVDLTVAIEIGIVLSSLLFMKRMADAGQAALVENDSDLMADYKDLPKEISVYEISGPFFFAASKSYSEVMKSLGSRANILIIRMRHVPFIDSTGARNFRESIRAMQASGSRIVLSGVRPEVMKELERGRIAFMVGKANILPDFDAAVKRAENLLQQKDENVA